MKSILSLAFGVAMAALLAAGCSSTPAPTPATSSSKPAAQAEKPAEQPGAAPAENKNAPEPTAAPRQDEANSVTIVATDTKTGQKVVLDFQAVYFDFDKYTIRADAKPAVSHNAAELNKVPDLNITIEGHCDERGTTEYNLALGEHRAVAVMQALESSGVKKARLKTVSYGKERPVDPGHDEAAWAKNRRGVIRES